MPTVRVLKSQKDFVATASHELKSPLAVMVANTDILTDNQSLDEPAKQAVSVIETECMRLSRLVKDMLLLLPLTLKHGHYTRAKLILIHCLSHCMKRMNRPCIKNGIQFKSKLIRRYLPCAEYR